jgi:hypothetical protein
MKIIEVAYQHLQESLFFLKIVEIITTFRTAMKKTRGLLIIVVITDTN